MANTDSAKKNIRASLRKKAHNLMWKRSVKDLVKSLKDGIKAKKPVEELNKALTALQKAADKAVKEKVIHKNKSNRLKSLYARKISALLSAKPSKAGAKPRKSAK